MKCKYPESVCGNMTVLNAVAYCDSVPCSLKEELPPMTNADRIRAMSDEEMAEFIGRIEIGDFGPLVYGKTFCDMCKGQYECDDCRLCWLQQPVGEDT